MILLKKHTLEPKNYFKPEAMGLNLEERNSTATLTLGPEAPEIGINDWLQDDTEPGKGIVWRVKSVRTQVDTNTRTVSLEHVIQYLKDRILWGEVTPKTITGKAGDKCTAKQAINYVLGKGGDFWKLGDLCENPSNPYSFNGDTVFSALETITSSIQDAQWEFDYSSLPFTLHIRRPPDGFQSEMRMSRNITNLSIQIDRTRMYTRHYPIGKNNLKIDGGYTEKNKSTWGLVCKVETDNSLDTKEKLKAWSLERLSRHCEPLITVTVGGLDLSRDTGEKLDNIRVGRRCRLPLPEYGTTVLEKVTKTSWADKIKDPVKFTVTMANQLEDVASIINSQNSSSGRSARAGAKKDGEDHAWIEDTESHVKLVAEAVAGPGAGEDWSRVSELTVDGEGIHQRVTRTEGEIVTMWASIDVLEDRIVLEVANAKSDTFSKIEQTAKSIRTEVNSSKSTLFSTIMQTATNIYTQVGNAKSGVYSKIEQTASSIRSEVNSAKSSLWTSIVQTSTQISLKVSKNGVISAINQTAETITIQASKINLDGYVTATNLSSQIASLSSVQVTTLNATNYIYASGFVIGSNTGGQGTNQYVSNAITDLQFVTSGSSVKMQKKTFANTSWTDVDSFNRATALSGEWSSGKLTVSANAGNVPDLVQVIKGESSWSGRTVTVKIYAYTKNDQLIGDTGRSITATYTLAKTNITLTRQKKTTEPSTDGTLSAITSNGWYQLDVTAAGVTKTWKVQVNV